jgi:hypothetical protein
MYTNVTNRSNIWLVLLAALLFCLPGTVRAQGNFTPSELDTLVANIALYPDPLLVQVLTASTYGDQIHPASVWADAHKNLTGKDLSVALERAKLPYDASVQALIPFPQVLSMMDRYPAWTEQLGDAVFMQKEEVMAAVQRLRRTASKYGHLRSDDRVKVSSGDNITITPVRTEYVYVPVYNPYYVYYRYYDGYARISYAPGIWIGGWFGYWGWGTCWFDWNTSIIYVRDTRWYPPRRHIPRRHHYAPPPPRHHYDHPHHAAPPARHHEVGPKLGKNPPPARPQASPRPRDDRHEARLPDRGFENRDGRRTASPTVWDDPKERNTKTISRPAPRPAPEPRSSSPTSFRSQYDDEGSQSTSRSSRNDNSRDDRDSRSDRGSSRGGFGKVIQRR